MNKHIEENLKHYITLDNPEYAVLLSGKWGSGKTYFIDKFVEDFLEQYRTGKEKNKTKFIKISLFGLRKVTQIDEVIFQELHPILGHKHARMIGNMLKSALKLGINFDVDGNGKTETGLSIDPKEFSILTDDKESSKELIFIFDDLERTNIELSEILGYINYLVEQSGFKVIILANEEEIENKENFLRFKEKVIGKTFEVKQDLDATFITFVSLALNSNTVLSKHIELIKSIYRTGGYNNLRHVRQTILDFEYFYNQLDKKFQNHNELMEQLVNEFFIFSIEIKRGILNSDNFKTFDYNQNGSNSNDEVKPLEIVFKKYSLQNEYRLLIKIRQWREILLEGYIKKEVLSKILTGSKYFIDDLTEAWRRLWDYRDLEDTDFKAYLKEVENKFQNNEYKEQGKLLHVIALLLYFSKAKMYRENQAEIIKRAKRNIRNCIKSEKWDSIDYDRDFGGGAYNLTFFDRESSNMKMILKYFEHEIQKSYNEKLEDKAKVLLEDFINSNFESLEKKLQYEFYRKPILSRMNIDEFISMLQNLKHKDISYISQILKKRYSSMYDFEDVLSEEKFWKSVNNRILKGINKNVNPVKYNLLKSFKEYAIKSILQTFEEERKRLSMMKNESNDG